MGQYISKHSNRPEHAKKGVIKDLHSREIGICSDDNYLIKVIVNIFIDFTNNDYDFYCVKEVINTISNINNDDRGK